MRLNIILTTIAVFILCSPVFSWEEYDRIIATVNETPIIKSELEQKFERLLSQKKIPAKKIPGEKSRLLDKFIDDAIVDQTAKKESIIVSPEKIDNQIKQIMARTNTRSMDDFIKQIEKNEKIPFEEYREELRKSLVLEQVMSIAIGISPPNTKEAKEWYDKNKKELGYEVNLQHILVKMKNDSFAENKRANNTAKDLFTKTSKQSFESAAKQYSDDNATRNNGGSLGWISLSDLAKQDILFANNIYKEFVIDNKKKAIVKSGSGYHIIKYNGKRRSTFEAVKNDIFNLLYQKKMAEQFKTWASRKRLESDIKIYMEDYITDKSRT
ncbi:MAG: peptidylprolyl isomerase [Spirochaetes bacterium]|nr:peptidylprolyl isomerase [Spirochaetota bacterium]